MALFEWPFPLSYVGDPSYAEYGWRWVGTPDENFHKGMDFNKNEAGTTGATIPAAADGTVVCAQWLTDGHGYCVMIDHGVNGDDTANHRYTVYSHQYQQPDVSVSQTVTQGQRVGGIGTTGNSGGNHLHFETGIAPPGATRPFELGDRINPRIAIPAWNNDEPVPPDPPGGLKPTRIQRVGGFMYILMSNGSRYKAFPMPGGQWHVSGVNPPAPDTNEWLWSFSPDTFNINNGHPEDGFRTVGRPNHNGFDMGWGIANVEGTPIHPAHAGTVTDVWAPSGSHGYGNVVFVTDPTGRYRTTYAHMYQYPNVSVNDTVTHATVLGGIGTTGNSFGNHLHFEVYDNDINDFIDPFAFMAIVNPSSGYVPQ